MNIPIEFLIRAGQPDTTEALQKYAARRLSFALRRFQDRIRHISVRLVDVNGPKRGVDSRCSIVADLVDGQQLFVEATAAWPFAAITQAASRLNEAVRRGRKRQTEHRADATLTLRDTDVVPKFT
jgi:ribosomal subunit interface protein